MAVKKAADVVNHFGQIAPPLALHGGHRTYYYLQRVSHLTDPTTLRFAIRCFYPNFLVHLAKSGAGFVKAA
jgi:hypothetical protein